MIKKIINVVEVAIDKTISKLFGVNFAVSGFGKGLKLMIEIIVVLIVLDLAVRLLSLMFSVIGRIV